MVNEPFEVVGQLLGSSIAPGRVLCHRLQDDRLQVDGNRGIEPPRRARLFECDATKDFLPVASSVDRLQRQQLVERRSQRIDVRSMVDPDPFGQRCSGLM